MRHNDTHGGTSMIPFSRLLRPRRTRRVFEACGRARSATSSPQRRGSALLLVIGALALISVFAAIYVTIGQGDQRATTAQELNRRVEAYGPVHADYIAQVIADDRLDTVLRLAFEEGGGPVSGEWPGGQNSTADLRQWIFRENTDHPSTDWTVRSIPSRVPAVLAGSNVANQQRLKYNASGTHASPWFVSGNDTDPLLDEYRVDRRVASDPWLASTAPTYLGAGPDRFSALEGFNEKHLISYLDNRDWAHISNLSPDGMFVNLYNLRGNAGGFNAEPGYTIGGSPVDEDRRMSDGLTLLERRGDGTLQAMDVRTTGFWVPGVQNPVVWNSGQLGDPENVPALWSTNQRFMLMPMDQAFFSYDRNGVIADWSSPDYPAYQYVDTDGDGLADARWFELTDSSESGVGNNQLSYRFLAPAEGYRLFAAARVVDLSSLVNLNVATDGMIGPTGEAMLTPSSIDLRRVLTMQDYGREQRDWRRPSDKGLALGNIKRDGPPPQRLDQGDAFAYYGQYQSNPDWVDPTVPPGAGIDSNATLTGSFALDAIALAIDTESSLSAGDVGRLTGPSPLRFVSRFDFGDNMHDEAALRQLMYADRIGGIDPTDPVARGATDLGAGLFELSDLSEMLTFWGANDDEVNSRLEQVLFGRYDDANTNITQTTRRFGPLLPNRPTELDRRRHDTLNPSGDPGRDAVTDGIVDPDSMALIALSPRRALTTFSGSTPILSSRLDPAALDTLSDTETPERVHDFIDGLAGGTTSVRDVFELYAMTLASNAQNDDAWDLSSTEHRTLFYGSQGPELAITLSSFLTANLIDAYDADPEPTPLAILAPESNTTLESDFDKSHQDGGAFPWLDGQKIKLSSVEGGLGVPQTREGDVNRLAYTVYGAEAYPVLTEVATMIVMTDAPRSAGGDDDRGRGGPPWVDPNNPSSAGPITIDSDGWDVSTGTNPWDDNPDLAMQVFVFQLTNPFDVPIRLGSVNKDDGEELNDNEYLYYLEFNGWMFRVCDYDEATDEYSNIVLDAGESRNFYMLANDVPDAFDEISDKWEDLRQGYEPSVTVDDQDVIDWVNDQFRVSGHGDPARVRPFDITTGMTPAPGATPDWVNVLKDNPSPPLGRTPTDQTVRLWRRMEVRTPGGSTLLNPTPEHDLLVDRLTQKGGFPTEGRPRPINSTFLPIPSRFSSDEVGGTTSGPEATSGGNVGPNHDNTGYTFVYYGSLRRGDHPSANPVQTAGVGGRGVLPGWMLEGGQKTNEETSALLRSGTKLRKADFDFMEPFSFKTFEDFMEASSMAPEPAVKTIARHPNSKTGLSGFSSNVIDTTVGGDPFYGVAMNADETVVNPELYGRDKDADTQVSDPYTGDNPEVSLVSVSDLLLIPAVGWIETPDSVNPQIFEDDQWVTFGEMLARALDVDGAPKADQTDPLHDLVVINGTERRYVLDRLHLRLDDYVAYYDADRDGIYRASAGSRDAVVGSGLPMAIDLLSRFRRFGAEDPGESLTTKVMGRINLNTATAQTLRSVPLLSPSRETLPSGQREFWGFDPSSPGATASDIGLPSLDTFETTPDIAAHLVSYRDRRPADYRASSFDYTGAGVDITQAGSTAFDYLRLDETGTAWSDTDLAGVLTTNEGLANISNPMGPSEIGRTVMTSIEGLREQLGFSTPAEIMAAVADPGVIENLYDPARFDRIRQNLPTAIGFDEDAMGEPINVGARSAGSTAVTTDRQLYGSATDQVANDYEEQLAVLNSVLATTDVRSDTFAVWFVVHGYQEGDVADLRDDDPLVPSFARRFVMVVDRSNVTRRGQRPRILMMREVPL